MPAPVINTVTSPVAVGNQVVVIGENFGRVVAAALVDTTTSEVIDTPDFIVDSGWSLHLTVPRTTPLGFYEVLLATLDGEDSTNLAGAVNVVDTPPPLPPEPVFPEPGTTLAALRERLRYELGDYVESFSASSPGDGIAARFDMPAEIVIADGLLVAIRDDDTGISTTLTTADYTLEAKAGVITLDTPVPAGSSLHVRGQRAQFFTDDELDMFLQSAMLKHGHNVTFRVITRNPATGRTTYTTDALAIENLPAVEIMPLALLATIEALWVIAADASYDIDVTTAEGTSLPRHQRYAAIMQMIGAQQARYDDLALKLNIGMSRIEMFTLRRVSRSTGRLVPIYQPREYDEHTPPTRVYPPVDRGTTGTGTTKRVHVGQQYITGP